MTIDVLEPVEGGEVVFQAIAPSGIDEPFQARISMQMRITNGRSTPISITRIDILDTTVSAFGSMAVAAGESYLFQNCDCDDSIPLIIDEPFPSVATIKVFLAGQSSPVELTVPIRVHVNDGGPLAFTGKANDLRQNETWGASSRHGSGHQVFALDMGVLGWNENEWSELFSGGDMVRKEDYRIYGMPVYAMADGVVCWALNDHQERPTTEPDPTVISPSLGRFVGGGNQIFVKSGDEIAVFAHFQPGSIPEELLRPGAPVRKGQYLGKVGLSGSTSHPHVHVHVKKEPPGSASVSTSFMNGCDAGPFRPMAFDELQSLTQLEATELAQLDQLDPSDWTPLSNHSAPGEYGLLYPSTDPHDFCKNCSDTEQYVGVWRSGDAIDLRVKRPGWEAFTQKWAELSEDGFRLVEINTFVENFQRQFLGVFKRGGGRHFLWNAPSWDDFVEKWDELSRDDLRLIDLATYEEGMNRHYVGVFRDGNDRHFLWNVEGWDAFTQKWAELSSNNLRLIDLETFPGAGTSRHYVGVFRDGNDAHALVSLTGWTAFTDKWRQLSEGGLRLIDIETFPEGSDRQFLGTFREGSDAYVLYSVTGYELFTRSAERFNADGLRLIDVHVEP